MAADSIKPTLPSDTKISVSNVTSTGFTISWKAASDNLTPASKLRYQVCWYEVIPGARGYVPTPVSIIGKTTHTFTNFKPNTEYAVYINLHDEANNLAQYPVMKQKTSSATTQTITRQSITRPSRSTTTTRVTTTTSSSKSTSSSAPAASSAKVSDAERRKAINNGLSNISYSPSSLINGTLFNDAASYPQVIESHNQDAAYMLEVREQQFSNKEIYVRGSGYENIYPGSIIYIDQDVTAGSPRTVGYLKRNKISIYGDFLAGTNTLQKDVEATNSSVRGASNNIMRILLADSRYEAPGRQQPKTEIYTSMKKLMMDFKVDASFAGIGVNVSAKTSSTEQKFIQATTFEQDYFTVKLTDSWKQDPSTLFADSVTWQDINAQLKGKAIAIVTSVTYGRTFSYMKEYSAKDFTYDGNQKVKGYGQEASSSQSLAESSSYSKDDVFNLGGTALSIAVLKSKKTQAELETAMADNMKFGHSNQGVVMKYTIQLITGDSPGRVVKPTYSGKYNEISYTRCPHNVEMHIKVTDVTIGAGKVKVQLDMEAFKVQNSKAVYLRKVDGNSSSKAQDAWFYTFSNSRNREYGDLKKGEYIYPNPLLRIRSKATGSGKYRADNSRRVDISSGKIRVELKGSVFAGKNVGIKSITEGLDAK